jgi:hypothetical protein
VRGRFTRLKAAEERNLPVRAPRLSACPALSALRSVWEVRRGLQAAELEELRKQQVRTPRRSCAALSVLCVDWSAAVCRQKRPSC